MAANEQLGSSSERQILIPHCWHVGIVVKDVKKVVDFYSRAFGWGPWNWVHVDNRNAMMRGKPTWYAGDRAFVKLGGVSLEIGETYAGESVHTEYMRTKGEGLHHLAFYVDDLEKEITKLDKMGIPILMTAFTEDGKHAYVYLNTEEWGNIIVELNQGPPDTERWNPYQPQQ